MKPSHIIFVTTSLCIVVVVYNLFQLTKTILFFDSSGERLTAFMPVKSTYPKNLTSTHFCHSRDLLPDGGKRASCVFQNLCVVPSATNSSRTHVDWLYISDNPPVDTSFTLGVGPHSVDERLYFQPIHVTPSQFQSQHNDKKKIIKGTSVVFYEYNAENFGHMLMDVLLPIFSALDGFDLLQRRYVHLFRYSIPDPLAYSCDFQIAPPAEWKEAFKNSAKNCARFYGQLAEMFYGDPSKEIQVLDAVDIAKNKMPICFEELLVGMSQYSDDCMEGSHGREQDSWSLCNHGRQSQFWRFRAYVLQKLGISNAPPKSHKITVTKRGKGIISRVVDNIDDLITTLRNEFGDHAEVEVVEWHRLTIVEQVQLATRTTVLVTPPGGVSFISIFLPRWATTIRLYSHEFRMEWHIMHYLGYIMSEHVKTPGGKIPIRDVVAMVDKGLKRYDAFVTNIP